MTETKDTFQLPTTHGNARAHVRSAERSTGAMVLGHGAGGGVQAPDLIAAQVAALKHGMSVALVEQPYRVAGRRAPAPARQLDAVWEAVIEQLRPRLFAQVPLIVGGRSMGARVACRTAAACRATAVLCLAFPLRPPRRSGEGQSRLPELAAVSLPTLVVQGENDRFGIPPAAERREVVRVAGDHSLRKDPAAVQSAIERWLAELLPAAG